MSSEKANLPMTYNNSGHQQRNPHRDSLRQNRENSQRTSHNEPRTPTTYNEPRTSNTYTDNPPRTSYNPEQRNPHRANSPRRNSHNSQRYPTTPQHNEYDVERQATPLPVPPTIKNHFIAASGEFVGTFMFLFFGFATHLMATSQAQTDGIPPSGTSSQTVVFIALGYGFSLLVTVWVWYRISGGLFNPAVNPPSLPHPTISLTHPTDNPRPSPLLGPSPNARSSPISRTNPRRHLLRRRSIRHVPRTYFRSEYYIKAWDECGARAFY